MSKNITISLVVRISLTAIIWGMFFFLMNKFEYLSEFNQIDNFVGFLPVILLLIGCGTSTAIVWLEFSKRLAVLSVCLAFITVASFSLFPNALIGNWWGSHDTKSLKETYPDISIYEPFSENANLPTLDEPCALSLEKNLPIIDGALALYPLYSAFAQEVYDKTECLKTNSVVFTDTVEAFKGIINKERDIIFSAYASKSQLESAKQAGVELCFTPIGKEAFVFIVGKNNPINNLSYQQIKNVYSGKTAQWATLGWKEGGNIIAFQRPDGSGSQTGLQGIMKDLPIQAPQPLPDPSLLGENSLMKQIAVEWKGVQPALGYSYRYFANSMFANPDSKMLSINGVAPTIENIKNGAYPFVVEFYAITAGEPTGNLKTFIDWILSPQGQELIKKTGYTPIK